MEQKLTFVQKPKNIKLVYEGTDKILSSLNHIDKVLIINLVTELKITTVREVTVKVLEEYRELLNIRLSKALIIINKLIKFFYYNLPKGFKRVNGIDWLLCNEEGDIIHFLRRYYRFHYNHKGYLVIGIKSKTYFAHRLIAKTWIPNPFNKEQVNHIDGVKDNNAVKNLEWNTNLENNQHARKLGLYNTEKTKVVGKGEKNSQAILNLENVKEIRQIFNKELNRIKEHICNMYKIDFNLLEDVLNFKKGLIIPILYKERTFVSKTWPGKIFTVKRRINKCEESNIRGIFNKDKYKLAEHLAKKYKVSSATIRDIIARRSWDYSYC